MDNQKNTKLKKYHSDKLEISEISGLSLFLWSESLLLMAKNQNGSIIGANLYSYQNKDELVNIVDTDEFLNSDNTIGKLYIYSSHFNLVPGQLFDPSKKVQYLQFSCEVDESTTETFYEGIDNNHYHLIGAIDKTILEIFDSRLPDLEVSHGASLFISYLLGEKSEFIDQELFILVNDNKSIYVAAFKSNELILFNWFPVLSQNDFLKYTLGIIQQASFDRLYCKTTVLGDLGNLGLEQNKLKDYFNHFDLPEVKSNVHYRPGAERLKETKKLEAFWC